MGCELDGMMGQSGLGRGFESVIPGQTDDRWYMIER